MKQYIKPAAAASTAALSCILLMTDSSGIFWFLYPITVYIASLWVDGSLRKSAVLHYFHQPNARYNP